MKNSEKYFKTVGKGRFFKAPIPIVGSTIETLEKVIDMPTNCPSCGSTRIRQKGREPDRRVVLHEEDGKLVKVHLFRPRCECLECRKTFYPAAFDFENNGPLSMEAADRIIKAYLEQPWLSAHGIATEISESFEKGSSSSIDRLIKSRVANLSAQVQLTPCFKLFCIPFTYKSRKNCWNPISHWKKWPVYLLCTIMIFIIHYTN